jgi:hypothetical protein
MVAEFFVLVNSMLLVSPWHEDDPDGKSLTPPPPSRPISQLTTVPVVYGQVHFSRPERLFTLPGTIARRSTRMP